MVVVSYSGKEINAKLVYYGAGLSGKTTNLESIYEAVPETSRGKMVSMKTQSDRTLFFDLLPLNLGEIMGFKTRFLLYTVPGQVFYNATRKLVLKGADAIVFVADSEIGKMEENKESLANLRANLAEYGVRLEELPWVLQYNKRDLENRYSVEELQRELNPDGSVPSFEAVASQGKGVFETFRGISHQLMEKVAKDLRRSPLSAGRREAAPAQRAEPGPVAPERIAMESGPAPGATTFDYGRELTLPAEPSPAAPPPAPVAPVAHAAPEAPAATPSKPSIAAPASARGSRLEVEPALRGSKTNEAPAPAATPPRALHPEPQLTGGRSMMPETEHAAPDARTASAAHETVIPISLPKGASREIVLRIVISEER